MILTATGGPLLGADIGQVYFYPFDGGRIDHAAAQSGQRGPNGLTLTLAPGKMADVVLWNGNPYSDYTRPERVWIDGAEMYDANDPKRRPVSDFELGQPGEGDVK